MYRNESLTREIDVETGKTTEIAVDMPFGDLEIVATGAQLPLRFKVFDDSKQIASGRLPIFLEKLKAGGIRVEASDGRFVLTKDAVVEASKKTIVQFAFQYGGAGIDTVPQGASIEMESPGQPLITGTTPYRAEGLLAGGYEARIVYKGAQVIEHIKVEEGKSTVVRLSLPIGRVKVGRRLFNAEYALSQSGSNRRIAIEPGVETEIASGDYALESRYGGIVAKRDIHVEQAKLTDIDPTIETGTLNIVSNKETKSV